MTTDLDKLPLPPGNRAFPLLGETLSFLEDGFGFVARRVEKHGPVFRTHLLGRTTVILAGPRVSGVFLDEELTARDQAMPDNVRELFGGRSLPMLDGDEHRARKRQLLAGFVPEALPSYVPAMEALVETSLSAWATQGEILAVDELKRLAITAIAGNVVSMAPGPDLDALLAGFKAVTAAFAALPIPLPGTAYARGLAARDAIFAILRRVVAEHRAEPRDDGLGRMLAYVGPDGSRLADDDAVKELHHVFIAGYIVFAELAAFLVRLVERPELRAELVAEVRERAPSGPLTARVVAGLPLLSRVVMETKRITPVVPIAFGRARKTFALEGYRIPEGTMLYWAPWSHDQDPATFPEPEAFDPGRFSAERAEHRRHEHGFAPQGMGEALGHVCPGIDYATLIMEVFAVVALRSFSWTLPEQRLTLDFSKIPPEPVDGLRIAFTREAIAVSPGVPGVPDSPARPSPPARGGAASSEMPHLGPVALRALASVIWADGVMTDDEAKTLVHVARASGLSGAEVVDIERATRARVLGTHEELGLDSSSAEHLFSLACLLAASDGSVDPRERVAVAALGDRLGLDERARSRAALASHAVAQAVGASGKALAALAAEHEIS